MDLLGAMTAGRARPITVAGVTLAPEELLLAAGGVSAEVAGAPVVGIEATPSMSTVVAVVGSLAAGVPVVPIPPDAGPLEREHILRDSGVSLVLGARLPPPAPFRPAPDAGDGIAMILYTSGTTGPPKGVMLTGEAIAADLDFLAEAWDWTPDDILVHGLPLFHVHGLILGVLGALRVGSGLVHTGRPTPEAYASAAGTLYFGVPTVWSRVAADASCCRALRSARLLVSGSAALPVPVFERLSKEAGQGPIERYGMTETLITVSGRVGGPRRPGWVGRPLPGVSTRIVGDDGAVLPLDGESVGSLEVFTPTVMAGYLNRPEETAAAIAPDGWVRTGDAAVVDAEGWHRIVGRESTDLIKSGGYRIGAGEVEAALLAHAAVKEAAVVGIPDEDLGQVVGAFVVSDGPVTTEELIEFVAASLSIHKRPRKVTFVEELPRNAMGKVQKNLLLGS